MPVDKQVILRYQVLNRCLRNPYREFTIDDLVDECNKAMSKELDKPAGVSKRTVQKDICELKLPPYNIKLKDKFFQGKKKLFRYTDTSFSLRLSRIDDRERHKIEDAIYVLRQFEGEPLYDWVRTLLMQIEGGLFDEENNPVVSFQTNLDLKGLEHFGKLLEAILNKRVLKISYTPYGKAQIKAIIYPYYLKQYNDRWYLLAQVKGYDTFAHYALDRIDSFKETSIPYKESDTEFAEYFDDVIGVTVPESESEDIVLCINDQQNRPHDPMIPSFLESELKTGSVK